MDDTSIVWRIHMRCRHSCACKRQKGFQRTERKDSNAAEYARV